MITSLTALGKIEKNKLYTGSTWILLLEIQLEQGNLYLCYNTEDVDWHGNHYIAFPFELGAVNESVDGSDPAVDLSVDNVSRSIEYAVQSSGGGVGTHVILRVINTASASDQYDAEVTEEFVVQSAKDTAEFILFRLGTEYSARTRRPLGRYLKDTCPFKYKGIECGYDGNMTTCLKTLTACREHGNSQRFGGFPGIDQKGVYL